ncbi:MAG: hypothetical protein ACK5JH_05760, partial [Anaerocolumna sp.]
GQFQTQGSQSQDQGNQNQDLGGQFQTQGSQSQDQGNQNQDLGGQFQTQGGQSQDQGNQNQDLGGQFQTQGSQSQDQGNQNQDLGDQFQTQGSQSQDQGNQNQDLGDQFQTQGSQSQDQGEQSQDLGGQIQNQGDQTQLQGQLASLGDQSEEMGDQSQTQGSQLQGDQTQGQNQGDQMQGQNQGDQTQGQNQGDQTQDQNQGDQFQLMTGHGGQSLGDQILTSSPSISTPVNVSGVTVNVTVSCCDEKKKKKEKTKKDCEEQCRCSITSLLNLLRTFSLAITDSELSQLVFNISGLPTSTLTGNIGNVTNCTFTVLPEDGSNAITFLTDSLNALTISQTQGTPSLFSLLLSYLQTTNCSPTQNASEKDCHEDTTCCFDQINQQLQAFFAANLELQIFVDNTIVPGFILKICDDIVYLVDSLTDPTSITAIPICKIVGFQPL